MHPLIQELIAKTPVITDGAWGTQLQRRGLGLGEFPDAWNLSHPEMVAEVARDYVSAGSQVILTNTFGANRYKLSRHGLDSRVADINQAAAELAQRVVLASFKDVLIAGDVGPLGVRLAPFGRVQPDHGY